MENVITSNNIDLDCWIANNRLRYQWQEEKINEETCKKVLKLQQLWTSNTGKEEWRNIPIVENN